jgi:hypothetical protein
MAKSFGKEKVVVVGGLGDVCAHERAHRRLGWAGPHGHVQVDMLIMITEEL